MASCDNPDGIDEHNYGGDDDSDSSTADEAQTPRLVLKENVKKQRMAVVQSQERRAKLHHGFGTISPGRKMTATKLVAATVAKKCHVQANLELLT